MLESVRRTAHASVIRLDDPGTSPFAAHLEFELRDDTVYYRWRAKASDGSLLASFSRSISLRVIPADADPFVTCLGPSDHSK